MLHSASFGDGYRRKEHGLRGCEDGASGPVKPIIKNGAPVRALLNDYDGIRVQTLNLSPENCERMDAENFEYCVGPIRPECDYSVELMANPKHANFPFKLRYKSGGRWLITYLSSREAAVRHVELLDEAQALKSA